MYNYYYPQQQQSQPSLNQLAQMAPIMNCGNPGYMQTVTQPMGLKGRPVSSIDEVRAAQIDFDGSLFIFPDVANRKIYTKQINLDGTASLNCYALQENVQPQPQTYVTKEEFDAVVAQLNQLLAKESRSKDSAIIF